MTDGFAESAVKKCDLPRQRAGHPPADGGDHTVADRDTGATSVEQSGAYRSYCPVVILGTLFVLSPSSRRRFLSSCSRVLSVAFC